MKYSQNNMASSLCCMLKNRGKEAEHLIIIIMLFSHLWICTTAACANSIDEESKWSVGVINQQCFILKIS